MKTYVDIIFRRHKSKGVIIDTNLLLLYITGKYDINLINSYKRTQKYSIEDYKFLVHVTKWFKHIYTTPNILTEVCNLADTLNKETNNKLFGILSDTIKLLDERYIESKIAITEKSFNKFGLSDTSIYYLSKKNILVLTDDFPLCGYLEKAKAPAINLNHIRTIAYNL